MMSFATARPMSKLLLSQHHDSYKTMVRRLARALTISCCSKVIYRTHTFGIGSLIGGVQGGGYGAAPTTPTYMNVPPTRVVAPTKPPGSYMNVPPTYVVAPTKPPGTVWNAPSFAAPHYSSLPRPTKRPTYHPVTRVRPTVKPYGGYRPPPTPVVPAYPTGHTKPHYYRPPPTPVRPTVTPPQGGYHPPSVSVVPAYPTGQTAPHYYRPPPTVSVQVPTAASYPRTCPPTSTPNIYTPAGSSVKCQVSADCYGVATGGTNTLPVGVGGKNHKSENPNKNCCLLFVAAYRRFTLLFVPLLCLRSIVSQRYDAVHFHLEQKTLESFNNKLPIWYTTERVSHIRKKCEK